MSSYIVNGTCVSGPCQSIDAVAMFVNSPPYVLLKFLISFIALLGIAVLINWISKVRE